MLKERSPTISEGTYIHFFNMGPLRPGAKTNLYRIEPKDGEGHLGDVRWFGRWRKYCFFPEPETVYEQVCLREIAEFCEHVTKEHRTAKK